MTKVPRMQHPYPMTFKHFKQHYYNLIQDETMTDTSSSFSDTNTNDDDKQAAASLANITFDPPPHKYITINRVGYNILREYYFRVQQQYYLT
jgi:hypothetical protein